MRQRWHDLLFAHWRIPAEQLRLLVPPELPIDEFEGSAWVGVIPFWMSGIRGRYLPRFPMAHTFPEVNVRTYVTVSGKPGVYFFSLDAASLLAVLGARAGFRLPYYWARMRVTLSEDGGVQYRSHRLDRHLRADLLCNYGPISAQRHPSRQRGEQQREALAQSQPGTLEYFLTERYCLYRIDAGRRVWRTNIHHLPWSLQLSEATFEINTLAAANGIALPDIPPVLHFARRLDVLVWMPERDVSQ